MRAMKHPNIAMIARSTAWLMIAATPYVGAQTPTPAAKVPARAAKPAADPAAAAKDQTSYLFGLTFGEQMHRAGITDQVSMTALARGVKDGLQGKKTTPADQQQLNAFVRTQMEAVVGQNRAAAKAFLARNSHEGGVTTTASGLQYKILSAGDSQASPVAPTDQVTVQYRGKLLDGSEFDSSYARGVPATFPVNGVIPGWQEALVLMKPGAKWQLFVPPELAYGANPKPGIPGGSLLIFDVELLSVKASAPPPAVAAPAASPAAAAPAPAPSPPPPKEK